MRKPVAIAFVLGVALAAACGKKANNDPPPAQPATGAPIALEAKSFKPGKDHGGSVNVKAYNFSDKKVAQYTLLFRYSDAAGNVLKVKEGTPFESEHDFMSIGGKRFMCEPKSWCSFTVKSLDVPDKTAKVEVLASSVTALKDDIHFEDEPLFHLSSMDWPGAKPAGDTAPATTPEGSAGSAAPEGSAGSAAPAAGSAGSAAPAVGSAAGSGSAG